MKKQERIVIINSRLPHELFIEESSRLDTIEEHYLRSAIDTTRTYRTRAKSKRARRMVNE